MGLVHITATALTPSLRHPKPHDKIAVMECVDSHSRSYMQTSCLLPLQTPHPTSQTAPALNIQPSSTTLLHTIPGASGTLHAHRAYGSTQQEPCMHTLTPTQQLHALWVQSFNGLWQDLTMLLPPLRVMCCSSAPVGLVSCSPHKPYNTLAWTRCKPWHAIRCTGPTNNARTHRARVCCCALCC